MISRRIPLIYDAHGRILLECIRRECEVESRSGMDKMNVGLVYRNITVAGDSLAGGGDFFVVQLIRILKELGHQVILATTVGTDWNTVERVFGFDVKPHVEVRSSFLPRSGGLRLYRDIIPSIAVERLKKTCDLTFNAYGDAPFWDTDLIYMHTPITREEIKEKYGKSPLARIYFGVYHSISKRLAQGLRTKILTNSNFSRECIRHLLSLDSRVIYPPVDTDQYRALLGSKMRERRVATVGRFSREKNLEVIPSIAERVKDAHFHLIGTYVGSQSEMILRDINRKSRELDVKDRVHIHPNASTRDKMTVLSRCRVYFHARQREYFGMSIAEAMSGGLVPIVHNSGGQVEIVSNEELLYADLQEASMKIGYWLDNWSPESSTELSEKAERFAIPRFSSQIRELLGDVSLG